MESSSKTNLLNFDRAGLEAFFVSIGEKPYRARQVLKWMYHAGVVDFDDMTDLSKALRTKLKEVAEVRPPEVALDQTAEDGTRKWLLKMDCGNSVETVFIPEDGRGTICVSSQVGCTLNCNFCSTARQGFNRNLSISEIIGQIYVAQRAFGNPHMGERVVTNVVLMGMGEPLMNFDNVMAATRLMTDDLVYGISKRRVTLSTAGVVPGIDKLSEVTDISLAVSLHAPNDALRDELVPLNKKYRIRELMASCKRFLDAQPSGRRITWEYVMLDGVNDKPEHAHQLVKLLRGIPSKVNLIPFNPFPGAPYKRSKAHALEVFRDILYRNGLMTITRKTRGDDIDAACGQLVGQFNDRTRRSEMMARADAKVAAQQGERSL